MTRPVILFECNEITWRFIEPMVAAGELPAFSRVMSQGAWGTTLAPEVPPLLDPWVTWTTLYSGQTAAAHGVRFLGQDPQTITAARIWELLAEQGRSVGVYGSLCSWPPLPGASFHVPDTFAPDPATVPAALRPVQELNLSQTAGVRVGAQLGGLRGTVRSAVGLRRAGVRPGTFAQLAAQLVRERRDPLSRWRRVALQPLLNLDVFGHQWRRTQPDLATFHTNHVAHYQHTYWNAAQPDAFPVTPSAEHVATFGDAVAHGYRVADRVLASMLDLAAGDAVVLVASSMGQAPYVDPGGRRKRILEIRSYDLLLSLLGVADVGVHSTMSDEFVLTAPAESTALLLERLDAAYVDQPDRPLFVTRRVGDSIAVNLRSDHATNAHSPCVVPGDPPRRATFEELIYDSAMWKAGRHEPDGVLLAYGPGIEPGPLDVCSTLDLAPTILRLLGGVIPPSMTGTPISAIAP